MISHALSRHRRRGLTLVEMIVVLAIIALVAVMIVPNVIGRPDQARVTVAKTDLKTIAAALRMYRLDNGDYPTTEQGLGRSWSGRERRRKPPTGTAKAICPKCRRIRGEATTSIAARAGPAALTCCPTARTARRAARGWTPT